MQLVVRLVAGLRGARRLGVGDDRLLPVADAGKNMRRHVLACGAAGRSANNSWPQRGLFRQSRRVVEMDQVVRDAGMLRLALEDRLEDRRALELHGISLIGRRGGDVELDRIEDLRFVVVG